MLKNAPMNESSMSPRSCLAVVLAAGLGTRMRSMTPKVLHCVGGRPMVAHVIAAANDAGADRLALVVGPDMPQLHDLADAAPLPVSCHVQHDRAGTAHAVLAAREALESGVDDVLVLFGDTPLITMDSIAKVRAALGRGADVVVLGFRGG